MTAKVRDRLYIARRSGLFDERKVLQECGLIISDFNSYMNFAPCVVYDGRISLSMTYEKRPLALRPKAPWTSFQGFRVHGVTLSRSGKELLDVIDTELDDQ